MTLRPAGGLTQREIVEIISRRREEESATAATRPIDGGTLTRVPTRELPPIKPRGE